MAKVLVVDDIKNIRMLLTTCLKLRGYEVVTAENGAAALEIIRQKGREIELIFLDIRMQGINGTEVLKNIREMGNSCPVVIMTAFATVKNAIDCTKLGAAAYLQKPFSPERVNAVLDEVNEIKNHKSETSGGGIIPDNIEQARRLIDEGNFETAHDKLKVALGINPYEKEVYYLLAKANKGLKNDVEADRFFKIAELFEIRNL